MALTSMIPKIWAARFLDNLNQALVYGRAVNREYQPDAQKGNIVSIGSMGDVAIGDYTKDTDISAVETLDSTNQDLLINIQKFFNFAVDSIDEYQTVPSLMDKAMARASYAMAQVVDASIAGLYDGFTNAIGTDAIPVTPDDTDIYSYFTQAARLLDLANVPVYGRYAIIDAYGIELLKNAGTFLSDTPAGDLVRYKGQFEQAGDLPMGYKGNVAGFDLYFSNQTPAGDTSTSVWTFGHESAIAMVDSVNEVVGFTPEKRFGDAVKGLYVYGTKVIQPTAGVKMFTTFNA